MGLTRLRKVLGISTSKQSVIQADGTAAQPAQKGQNDASSTSRTSTVDPLDQPLLNPDDNDVPIRELWNIAYDKLRKEDERLIKDYEYKVQKNLKASISNAIDSKISMRDQMDIILRSKMDEVNQNTWKLRFGSSEVQVKDLAQPILSVINWANTYINGALTPNLCASMAWAGVSLLLPLFLNPSKQAASLAKGLQDISSLLAQSRMREDLYVRRYEAKARTHNQESPTLAYQEYKNSLELLYREILRFQATSYCYYASNDAFQLGLDIVRWDGWDKLLGQIRNQERRFSDVEALWRDFKYDEECSDAKRRHQESLQRWGEICTNLSGLRTAVEHAQTVNSRQELLKWLSDIDPSEIYNTARDKHGAGTGEWLTKDSEEFRAWKETPSSLLWLHGMAGSGKSVLSSVVIKDLQDQHASNPLTALAYFFFSFSDLKKQKVNQMLASLVRQLCSRRPDTPQPIKALSELKEKGQHPDTKKLGDILAAVTRGFSAVHIVIDALDECPLLGDERKMLFNSLRQIMAAAPANLHIFCTSRREVDIQSAMEYFLPPHWNIAEIDLTVRRDFIDHDIGLFIDSALASDDCRSWPEGIKAEARKLLIKKADGMFQYVFFQLEVLRQLSSPRLIREALQDLPLGLDATYDRLLLSLNVNFRSGIISCLKWLAFSNKVLELEQLAEIFILRPRRALVLDESDRLFDPKDVLKYLSSLIVIRVDKRNSQYYTYIRLAHFSVKEYLISSRICEGPAKAFAFGEVDAHLYIADCCLAYHLQRSAMADNDRGYFSLQLYKYAAIQWPSHLEMVPRASWPSEVTQAAARALAIRSRSLDYQLKETWLYDKDESIHLRLRPQCYTARLGFVQLTDMLLSRETGVNKYLTKGDLNAALHDAAYGGNDAAVHLCLDKGADVNSKSEVFGDALQAAAYNGHATVVRLLLESGADINAQRGVWGSALQAAAMGDQLDILKLLVSLGADIDLPSNESGCVLTSAITNSGSSFECLLYLLEAGADINRPGGGIHGTALHKAAMGLNNNTRKHFHLLLGRGADVNAPGGKYGYPLQAVCASGGSRAEIKCLLDMGADVNARGGKYGNALQAACYYRHHIQDKPAIELLIDEGADINAEGGHFGTALQAACARGYYETIVHLLLDKGADVNIRGGEYGSALNAACLFAREEVPLGSEHEIADPNWTLSLTDLPLIEQLLDRGADLNEPCGGCGTALQAACEGNMTDLVQILLDRGAEVNVQGGKYGTALQAACVHRYRERVDVCKLLLEHGADAHTQGGFFGSVWHAAAAQPDGEFAQVLQQLLDLGVDINDIRGKQQPTALHAALGRVFPDDWLPSSWSSSQQLKIWMDRVRFLVDHGADVNLAAGTYGPPLQLACAMEAKANSNWPNDYNRDYEDHAILFLENLANLDVNQQGGLFGSALQAAAWTGKAEVVSILLRRGADVNVGGGKYGSSLNAAIVRGYWDIVEILLDHGAKPDCYHSQEVDNDWLHQIEEECGEEAVERYQLFWAERKSKCASSV
ncbi:ankyrin repeat-containing domain protein [Trichoderma austrokoningii]